MSETQNYRLHHTMLRVKDIEASKRFYCDVLGMKLIAAKHFPQAKFSLYFFTYQEEPAPENPEATPFEALFERRQHFLELTHNHGTELDSGFTGYKSGNEAEHKGFGHICIAVPDIYAACARIESMGGKIRRKPGPMMDAGEIAFAEDPDSYWVEIVPSKK